MLKSCKILTTWRRTVSLRTRLFTNLWCVLSLSVPATLKNSIKFSKKSTYLFFLGLQHINADSRCLKSMRGRKQYTWNLLKNKVHYSEIHPCPNSQIKCLLLERSRPRVKNPQLAQLTPCWMLPNLHSIIWCAKGHWCSRQGPIPLLRRG
jgi:hypothetical protein